MDTFFRIQIEEAQQKLRSSNALFIDVRDYLSHTEGHIEPSFHMDQNNINTLIKKTLRNDLLSYTATTVTAANSRLSF